VLRCRESVRAVQSQEAKDVDTGTGSAFGALLRHHRNSANITQEDLAARAGLTSQAIGLLERGERRRPHRYTVDKLAEALELTGRDLASFETAARRSPILGATAGPSRRDLPAPATPLVGRDHEAVSVLRLLLRGEVRLLTLTGPGGVGKTRLALEVAARSRGAFADGVAFVPLAHLEDPDLVPSALAEAIGIKEVAGRTLRETLEQHLRGKQMLLLIDNFEHLLGAAPLVAELVGTCPELTVLVSSRAPLRLGGEHQFSVPPLPLPEEACPVSAGALERSAAVELFRQRAQAVSPDFELTDANSATVTQICRRLDGLPLAIELAAARIKLFPPRALLDRLDRGLHLLGGGARDLPERQQTLRNAIAWSYDLLDVREQALFCRLAVFAGGCSPEAAEAVCGCAPDGTEEGDGLEGLAALVDGSLLVSGSETSAERGVEEPRFTMLQTIREYAAERLRSSGEAEETQRKHAMYYLALAEAAQPETSGRLDGVEWWSKLLRRLEGEHDNLRAALGWAIQNREAETGARLAVALWRLWIESTHLSEGRRWTEAVLALDASESRTGEAPHGLPARTRAYLLQIAGILAMAQGDHDRAGALHEEAMVVYRDLGHKKGVGASLRELGFVAYERGDYERAVRLHERSLALAREFGTTFSIARSLRALADAVRGQGDLGRATALLEEGLALSRGLENAWGIVRALASLASVTCESGEYTRANRLYEESLDLGRRVGFKHTILPCLEGLARVAAAQGRMERTARLSGAAAALREEAGWPLPPAKRAGHDRTVTAARTVLGEDAFTAAWAKGHALPLGEAIRDALGDDV
jgi:predicted ATPase/DNA-binding XRE family transcriptional regulator